MALDDIASYIFVVPLAVLVVRYSKLTDVQRWIALLVVVSGLTSLTAYELAIRGIYNTPVIHVYAILELSLYTWIFHKSMPERFTQKLAYTIIIGFSILSVLNSAFLQTLMEFNSNARGLQAVILIVLPITYFYHLFQEMKVFDIQNLPSFWISSGALINFSANFLYYAFRDWLLDNHWDALNVAYDIAAGVSIILYIMLAIALFVDPAKVKMK